jgi:hypothetical protein
MWPHVLSGRPVAKQDATLPWHCHRPCEPGWLFPNRTDACCATPGVIGLLVPDYVFLRSYCKTLRKTIMKQAI